MLLYDLDPEYKQMRARLPYDNSYRLILFDDAVSRYQPTTYGCMHTKECENISNVELQIFHHIQHLTMWQGTHDELLKLL